MAAVTGVGGDYGTDLVRIRVRYQVLRLCWCCAIEKAGGMKMRLAGYVVISPMHRLCKVQASAVQYGQSFIMWDMDRSVHGIVPIHILVKSGRRIFPAWPGWEETWSGTRIGKKEDEGAGRVCVLFDQSGLGLLTVDRVPWRRAWFRWK